MPSILRNSRYRRDQRQMDEEEELWFNDEDDFEDTETVLPAANDMLTKKLDTDLDSIGKIMEKRPPPAAAEANGPKMNNNSSSPKSPHSPQLHNNNTTTTTTTTAGSNATAGALPAATAAAADSPVEATTESKTQLIKRVSKSFNFA